MSLEISTNNKLQKWIEFMNNNKQVSYKNLRWFLGSNLTFHHRWHAIHKTNIFLLASDILHMLSIYVSILCDIWIAVHIIGCFSNIHDFDYFYSDSLLHVIAKGTYSASSKLRNKSNCMNMILSMHFTSKRVWYHFESLFLNKVFYNSTYQMHKFFNKCLLCNKILVPSFDERQESRKEFYYLLFQIKCNKALNYLIWDKTQIICLRGFIIFWLRTFKYNCIWEYKD